MFGSKKKKQAEAEAAERRRRDRDQIFNRIYPQGFPEEAATGEFREATPEEVHDQTRISSEPTSVAMVPRDAKEERRRRKERRKAEHAAAKRHSSAETGASGRADRWWALAPILLFLGGAGLVFWSQFGVGYAWDEAYYYEPALKAGEWVVRLAMGDVSMVGEEQIDRLWAERSEHPSFHKLIAGLALVYLEDLPGIGPLTAMRIPSAILFGLTLALIFLLGSRAWSAPAGLVAALAYLAMPRVFGHANFSSLETPLLFGTMLVVYCFVRGLVSPLWAVATGAALGLLVATKINAFFLIPPLIVWGQIYARRHYVNNFFAMTIVGPLVFVLMWPWLWHHTAPRVLEYLSFHATHQQTALWFLGRKWGYGAENAPWFYPSVMIAVTLPVSVLLLSALGLLGSLAQALRRPLPILFLLIALVMWAVASAPGTPRYDGVRLFLPVFPFLALFAGGGAELVLMLCRWSVRRGGSRRAPALVTAVLALALAIEGGWAIAGSHPYLLSYFSPAIGGVEGAEELGFETTYWGEAVTDDVIETLNRLPEGASVRLLSLHEMNFQHLQRWSRLKPSLRIGGPPPYDYHLLLHRRGFFNRPERALADYDRFPPVETWEFDGVTALSLHRTGSAFEAFWPSVPNEAPSPANERGLGPPSAETPPPQAEAPQGDAGEAGAEPAETPAIEPVEDDAATTPAGAAANEN